MKKPFDLIFCDPPFPYQYKWDLLGTIAASPLAGLNTRLLLHRPREDYQKSEIPPLVLTDTREYGRSVVDFFSVAAQ
ncbi:hypothetical protein AGMMS49928_22230 [Spirochaetia bacterium]|nr:hypothetical protein AGMMS49928_22230 [Spirochaetia bacterium]